MSDKHTKYLLQAHNLAYRNFGKTFPNPTVGCIIVKNNKIISKASTASAGRPHAEEIALSKAGKQCFGATMYVTLEPCNHESPNGSCINQIIRSGINKIFIANIDPDPRTNRKSIKKLIQNNIKVNVGLTKEKTYALNKFFFKSLKNKRPYTKIKMASSKDEKIAWKDYSSKWITNSKSRNYAHKIRFQSQAILTTSKTVIKDNPRFTSRRNNKIIKYLPVIIIDKSLKIPLNSYLIKSLSRRRVIIFTSKKGRKFLKLKSMGCEMFLIENKHYFNLSLIMKKIFLLKINDILVEAGGIFFTNLLSQKLVDEIHLFTAPFNIGDKGKPMIINKKMKNLNFEEIDNKKFGKDVYQHLLNKR